MLGALFTLIPYAAYATLACSNPNCWQVGGDDTVTAAEIEANVDVPNSASNTAIADTTYYWIGGYTTSSAGTALTQPGFQNIQSSTPWRGVFQVAIGNTQEDFQFTNLYWSHPGSIALFDELFPSGNTYSGQNYQQMVDNNNSLNADSVFFHTTTYGHTMSEIDGALESYDFTGSDFSNMDSTPIHFTSFNYAATYGGSFSSVPLSAFSDASSGASAPSCITSTASSGSTTVSLSC